MKQSPNDGSPARKVALEDERAQSAASVTERRRVWAVPASPFNSVKFELGVILLVTPLVWLVSGRLTADAADHVLVLGGFGAAAALWLVVRTRSAMRRALARRGEAPHGPQ